MYASPVRRKVTGDRTVHDISINTGVVLQLQYKLILYHTRSGKLKSSFVYMHAVILFVMCF